MKLIKAIISNFRGIGEPREIHFDDYNVIVGKNDAGKSTILKALDLFLNDSEASKDIINIHADSTLVDIELIFDPRLKKILIDDSVETTFEEEELVNEEGFLHIKKVWNTQLSKVSAETYLKRKKYLTNDFVLSSEKDLMAICKKFDIETSKGNGEAFNNVEKRTKIREHLVTLEPKESYVYEYEKLPTSGTSRLKLIGDTIKKILPRFEYFKADASLSESDTAIQNYFKKLSENKIKELDTDAIESSIRDSIGSVLNQISSKINQVLSEDEKVEPEIKFDWSKLITTNFKSANQDKSIPLKFRGDGFRRITMMAYFEYLAEESRNEHQNIIFGFEEPESFLHPSAQEGLFEKLKSISENGYQVFLTTHSPTIVSFSDRDKIIHIRKEDGQYFVYQSISDFTEIVNDLGINLKNQLISEFDKAQLLLLVEGPDDVRAMNYTSEIYSQNNLVTETFAALKVILIPAGGCDSIKHWVTFSLLQQFNKPYHIILDSDKNCEDEVSPNLTKLLKLNFEENIDFTIWKKRSIENYINIRTLKRKITELEIEFDSWTNVKSLCKTHPKTIKLGGSEIARTHFTSQNFEELRESFEYEGGDEFLDIYNQIKAKLMSNSEPSILSNVSEITLMNPGAQEEQ
ncbi:AAA family ATPase [Adhaeribacter sp. BT258]|uniref:AAA family ATPase n=1 Tax=Adhaeribacter terrigena TaxID=2793070 RepID=A0ABS1C2S7_9BACT|nr:AAA family ATPase [Adhaeribacter terrigena]MBK0403628.1 AAA family ATPase [Adhaeribacter terrigena]